MTGSRILGHMDQVKIRASVSAHGLVKGQEVTVAETPVIKGALKTGVFVELERFPAPEETDADTVRKVEDVELPGESPKTAPKQRRRGGQS